MDQVLQLNDGTLIDRETGEVLDEQDPLVGMGKGPRTKLGDLPGTEKQLPGVAAMLVLDLLGVGDLDIGYLLKIDEEVIENIREGDVYEGLREMFLLRVGEHIDQSVVGKFKRNSHKAADKLIGLMDQGDGEIELAATNSLLDRAGHGAKQVHHHKHDHGDGLVIRVLKDEGSDIPVTIEG